jgi:hypothetical protein
MRRPPERSKTAMPRRDLQSQIAGWRKLLAGAKIHEVELPALGPFMDALEESLDEVVATNKHRDTLKDLHRESGRELKAQRASGSEMAARLKSFVRACFGRKDERLDDFGIKLPGRPRKKPPSERKVNGSPGYH